MGALPPQSELHQQHCSHLMVTFESCLSPLLEMFPLNPEQGLLLAPVHKGNQNGREPRRPWIPSSDRQTGWKRTGTSPLNDKLVTGDDLTFELCAFQRVLSAERAHFQITRIQVPPTLLLIHTNTKAYKRVMQPLSLVPTKRDFSGASAPS